MRDRFPWGALVSLIGIIVFVVVACVGLWLFERHVHYKLSYESKVKETVREMVSEECLNAEE